MAPVAKEEGKMKTVNSRNTFFLFISLVLSEVGTTGNSFCRRVVETAHSQWDGLAGQVLREFLPQTVE